MSYFFNNTHIYLTKYTVYYAGMHTKTQLQVKKNSYRLT